MAWGPLLDELVAGDYRAAGRRAWQTIASVGRGDKDDQAVDAVGDSPAAPRYRVGDRARLLVRSPFAGQLLLCVETDGVVSRRVIDMPASQMVVWVDVPEGARPNAYVTAMVVRAIDPNAAWRAHRAAGAVRLSVDPADRALSVQIDAPAEMRPQTTLSANVRVIDDKGRPAAGAAVTVAAVDDGILSLTGFQTPDPLRFFTASRALGVTSIDLYSQLMPEVARPEREKAIGGDRDQDLAGAGHVNPIVARRVNSVALFTGVLHTDANGVARVELPVGAFAGRLRLMAVAYSGSGTNVKAARFGSAEARTRVRAPIVALSSWPRFASPGDAFVVPVTLLNNTDTDQMVRVKLSVESKAAAPLLSMNGAGPAIDLPPTLVKANGQALLRVNVTAADSAGVARIQIHADAENQPTFNESLELPIRPAAPMMAQGGFVEARPGAPAAVMVPGNLLTGTGELQVRVSPWPALGLPRGLAFLDRYPYGCAEQTTSTAFPLVYLGDVGDALAPGMFDRQRLQAKVQSGALRLMGMQTADGGLAMWPGGSASWPWASVYAAHFLVEAKAAGHDVPEDFQARLLGYCRGLLERSSDSPDLIEAQAYAGYVLALAGQPPRATLSRLAELLNQKRSADDPDWLRLQTSTARSNLAMAWLAAGRRDLAAELLPQILPEPVGARQLGGNIGSPIRDQAVLLSALLSVDPNRPQVAALAKRLADAGANGQWSTTQETSFALAALGRYLKVVGKSPAYDSVELWADGRMVASAEGGKALAWDLPAGKAMPAQLQVRAKGAPDSRAFASWVQHGVPVRPPVDFDAGMRIRRRYLDRQGNPIDIARLVSGDLVQVELTLSAGTPLENVVIEDLLPAGLEVENPRLDSDAISVGVVDRARSPRREDRPTPPLQTGHLDARDDRVVVVARLPAGEAGRFCYVARAVTPGVYRVAPVRAECMYDAGISSVWGGGGTMKVSADRAATADEKVAGGAGGD